MNRIGTNLKRPCSYCDAPTRLGLFCSQLCKRRFRSELQREEAKWTASVPPPGAQPKRLRMELTLADVADNRQFECRSYDACVNYAGECNWQSFSCAGCSGPRSDA